MKEGKVMNKSHASQILRIASLSCAALAAVLEVIAVFLYYEKESNYFQSHAILPKASIILALLGLACGIAFALLSDKLQKDCSIFSDHFKLSPLSIGTLTASVFALLYCKQTIQPIIGLLAALLLLCGFIYSILLSAPTLRKKTNLTALFGLLAVIGTVFLNAYYYFDVSIEMNAPFKLITQMGLLFVSVYLTGEIRFLLGKAKPRIFLGLCIALISVGSLCSLSLIIAFFCDKTDRGDYVAGAFLVLCAILSATLRMKMLLTAKPNDCEKVDEVSE